MCHVRFPCLLHVQGYTIIELFCVPVLQPQYVFYVSYDIQLILNGSYEPEKIDTCFKGMVLNLDGKGH